MKKYKLIKDYPLVKMPCIVHELASGLYGEISEVGVLINEFEPAEIENYPEFWQEVKEISVRIDKFKILEEYVNWLGKPELIKKFETKEAAEQWIKENKPRFSEKQVLDALDEASAESGKYIDSKVFKKELGL